MASRFTVWPALFEAFLSRNRSRRFRYGSWDCCLFVADAIEAMTGTDVASEFRGRYDSRATAVKVTKEYCGRASIAVLASAVFSAAGFTEVAPAFAQRGDAVLIRRSRDFSLGIVALNGMDVVITSNRGLWKLPLSRATRAWRV